MNPYDMLHQVLETHKKDFDDYQEWLDDFVDMLNDVLLNEYDRLPEDRIVTLSVAKNEIIDMIERSRKQLV